MQQWNSSNSVSVDIGDIKMIIIIGDSWGVGEWGFDTNEDYCLTGPGIGSLMSMHHRVINLSKCAGSNTDSLNRLTDLLDQFTPAPGDRFFWIVTCPSRCILSEDELYGQNFEEISTKYLFNALDRANTIAEKFSIEIELIGGVCDLPDDCYKNFKHLNVLVQSWGKLLDKNYPTCTYSPSPEILTHVLKDIEVLNRIEKKYKFWENSNLFPDNGHPNTYSHRILRDFIFPELSHIY